MTEKKFICTVNHVTQEIEKITSSYSLKNMKLFCNIISRNSYSKQKISKNKLIIKILDAYIRLCRHKDVINLFGYDYKWIKSNRVKK